MSSPVHQEAQKPSGAQSPSEWPSLFDVESQRALRKLLEGPGPSPLYTFDAGPPGTCMYCLKVDEHHTGVCPFMTRVPKNEKISDGCDVVCILCGRFFRGSCCGLDEGRAVRKTCYECGRSFSHWTIECPQLRNSGKEDQHPLPEPPKCNRLVSQTERPIPFSNNLSTQIRGIKRGVSKPAPAATSSFSNSPDFHRPSAPASKTVGPEAAPAPYNPSSKIGGPGN